MVLAASHRFFEATIKSFFYSANWYGALQLAISGAMSGRCPLPLPGFYIPAASVRGNSGLLCGHGNQSL